MYVNLYTPRQQAGRQKTLDRMVASIPRIYSAPNLFVCVDKAKAVPLHATKALGGSGDIAHTYYRPRH
jgi:hypothetical protein